jgi:hypothetical protein
LRASGRDLVHVKQLDPSQGTSRSEGNVGTVKGPPGRERISIGARSHVRRLDTNKSNSVTITVSSAGLTNGTQNEVITN